jgi:hypothetical protein
MTQISEARKELTELFLMLLPSIATEEQKTEIGDKVFDCIGDILDAVEERYHVIAKNR